MTQLLKLTRKDVAPILSVTFPDYTGRKFHIRPATSVWFHDLNWEGGTKNTYIAVNAEGKTARMPDRAPWNQPAEGKEVELPSNVLIVEHSHFCGKDLGITIHVHPSQLPKWLKGGE